MVASRFCKFLRKKVFLNLVIILVTLFVMALTPVLILIFSPIYLFRYIIFHLSPTLRPDLGKMLCTRSALSAVDDVHGSPNLNLVVSLELEGDVDIEKIREAVIRRVITYKNEKGELSRPELQQYLTTYMGFYFWKWDPNFDVRNHVYYYENENGEQPDMDEDELFQLEKVLIKKPHPKERSLWDMIIVRNYKTQRDFKNITPKSVMLLRIHHSVADGFSIIKLLLHIADQESQVVKPLVVKKSIFKKMSETIAFLLKAPFEGISQVIESYDKNEWHLPEHQMTKELQAALSDRIPLPYLKEIKNMHGVTLTSVIFAAITGGIRNYMLKYGVKIPETIHCGTALPVPGHPDKLRNHMTMCFVTLPLGQPNPVKRLKKIHNHMEKLKNSTIPSVAFTAMPISGGLFTCMIKVLVKNFLTTALLTNMPGPSEQMFYVGYPVLGIAVGSGLLPGNTALGFTILSYKGAIKLAGGADRSVIPTDEKARELLELIIGEFDVLRKGEKV